MNAKLLQINVNPAGGVPKTRVPRTRLETEGVAGDKQRYLKFHGGPLRAVCLYSAELIEKLRAEGHPIEAGWTGENLTITGLDWDELTPGTQLQVGEATLEIASYTKPCKNIAFAFEGGDWNRIHQKKHPGWSRLYARVTVEGEVSEGDEVRVTRAQQQVA